MKKPILGILLLSAAASLSLAQPRVFTGEIMDAPCARMGNHTAGYAMTGTKTPKDCTLACAKAGARLVLYDAARKVTFQLDDQTKPKAFAGENVRVLGAYNRGTNTIHVEKIEAAR